MHAPRRTCACLRLADAGTHGSFARRPTQQLPTQAGHGAPRRAPSKVAGHQAAGARVVERAARRHADGHTSVWPSWTATCRGVIFFIRKAQPTSVGLPYDCTVGDGQYTTRAGEGLAAYGRSVRGKICSDLRAGSAE
eukprot:5664343-Prymnesium_polylepis.1